MTRVCLSCGVAQVPEAGASDRVSMGSPRFEAHHRSRKPEVLVWLCVSCHSALHNGLNPEWEGLLLAPEDRGTPARRRTERDASRQLLLTGAFLSRRSTPLARDPDSAERARGLP